MTRYDLLRAFPTFDDLPLNRANGTTFRTLQAVANGTPRNLLLYGAHGSGKTTLAQLLPEYSYQSQAVDFEPVFFDCSDSLDLRRLKQPQTSWAAHCGAKEEWYILDEADKIANQKQIALLGLIKNYIFPRYFILTANDLNAVHAGIRSRCQPLEIKAPTAADYLVLAQSRLRSKGLALADNAVLTYLQSAMATGDIRQVERALEDVIIAKHATANNIAKTAA